MLIFWRTAFLLLIFANLLFFAWSQGYFGRLDDGREPQRYSRQLEPGRLRLMPADQLPPDPPPVVFACRLLDGLKIEEARKLLETAQAKADSLAKADEADKVGKADRADALKLTLTPLPPPPSQWVHIPPQPNKAAADKKLQEVKQRGVTDASLVLTAGPDRLAISFGTFNNLEAATARLQALKKHGIRSAIISPRPRPAQEARVEARGPQTTLAAQLPGLLDSTGLTQHPIEDCKTTP